MIDKMMYAGLGAISMTRQRAEKLFDDYVKRGQAEKEKRTGFIKDVMETSEKTRKEFENLVSEQVKKVVKQMNVATSDDIKRLEKKLDKLMKQQEQ